MRARLYCMAEVREITLSAPMRANSWISASVMPSAKYSCAGSPERFSSGSTASEEMRRGGEGAPAGRASGVDGAGGCGAGGGSGTGSAGTSSTSPFQRKPRP